MNICPPPPNYRYSGASESGWVFVSDLLSGDKNIFSDQSELLDITTVLRDTRIDHLTQKS